MAIEKASFYLNYFLKNLKVSKEVISRMSFPLVGNPSEERLRTCLPDRQASRSDNEYYNIYSLRSIFLIYIIPLILLSSCATDPSRMSLREKEEKALEYFKDGTEYFENEKYEKAVGSFERSIEIVPENPFAYYLLGNTYEKLRMYGNAVDSYKQAIRLKQDIPVFFYSLGIVYIFTGKYQEAVDIFTQAVKLHPGYAEAYYGIGLAYGEMGRYDEAINNHKKAVKANFEMEEAHAALGLLYVNSGDIKSALKEYHILRALNPVAAEYLLELIKKKQQP